MKILVTGGSGLVGYALQQVSNKSNEWVFLSTKDCDLLNEEETRNCFTKHKPEIVVHLAAMVGGLYDNMMHNGIFFRNNMKMSLNVFDSCLENKTTKVISCLSTCIFPDSIELPMNEFVLHNGPPHSSNYGYAYAKRMIDIMSRSYNETFKSTLFQTVIPTNIFGPNDNFNIEKGHVIPSLIHKCYLAKINNTDFVIRGNGSARRQFIYSIDMAKLINLCIEKYDSDIPLILSTAEEYSIQNVVDAIVNIMGFTGNVVYDTSYPNGQFKKTVSNERLCSYFKDFQFTPFYSALEMTIEWFIKNYETCRK